MPYEIAQDTFDYADNASLAAASPNWTTVVGTLHGPVKVVGGAAAGGYAAYSCCRWNADVFPADQYAEGTLSLSDPGYFALLAVRITPGATDSYYFALSASAYLYLYRFTEDTPGNGWLPRLMAWGPTVAGVGDVVRLEAVANKLTVYVNGASVIEATDNRLTGGSPGVGGLGTTALTRIGSWRAGGTGAALPEAPHPEVKRAIGRPGRPGRALRR